MTRDSLANIFFSIGISLLTFAIINSKNLCYIAAFLFIFTGISLALVNRRPLVASIGVASLSLLFVFLSSWLNHGYNFFQGPSIKGELLVGSIIAFFLLKKKIFPWHFLLAISAIVIFISFLTESNGRVIYSDDLSVFFYRFQLLKENFPNIPFFNPLWNAGIDSRDFFASGSLNFFLLFSPIIYAFNLSDTFTVLIGILIFFIAPLASYIAAKKYLKLPEPTPSFAGILMLSLGLPWYRWALKYGTLGFITSASLLPLLFALSLFLFEKKGKISAFETALIIIITSLVTFWSLSFLVILPLAFYGLINIKTLLKSPKVITIVALLLLIFAVWVPIFFTVSQVSSFVNVDGGHVQEFRHKDQLPSFKIIAEHLAETAISTNPLLLFLTLPGLWLLQRRERRIYGITFLWLLFLGSVAVTLKPQLELDRMLVVASALATIPTALALSSLVKENKFLSILPMGFLLVSPFISASVVRNRSVEHFSFASEQVTTLSDAIKSFGGEGRTLFSGFVLHELSNGHLAPLVLSSKKPIVASSFVHNRWRYQQIIPKEFIERGDTGIEEYFSLMNATAVLAHEREWREYFQTRPNLYKEVWRSVPFIMFQRIVDTPNYFLTGSGEITAQETNSVKFKLSTEEAVLKFNYFPFLKVDGCAITAEEISPSIKFVKLSSCPINTELTLNSRSAWWRVLNRS